MNKEELSEIQQYLLEEAKRKYPIGTQYIGLRDNEYYEALREPKFINTEEFGIEVGIDYIYKDGKWAEIVSKPEEKPQFEVGKWYKLVDKHAKDSWYVKNKFDNEGLDSFKECIFHKQYSNIPINLGHEGTYKYELLTDLSEIQQYLPDGHVDKIVNNIPEYVECYHLDKNGSEEGFTIGKIYKIQDKSPIDNNGIHRTGLDIQTWKHWFKKSNEKAYEAQFNKTDMNPLITTCLDIHLDREKYYVITYTNQPKKRYIVIGNGNLNTLQGISIHEKRFFSSSCFSSNNIKIQEALFSDREWLDRCIKAGKYLAKEELNKEEPKPVKAVIHCTTQEEWDFVTEKLGYSWSSSKWSDNKENSCININRQTTSYKSYYEAGGFKIYPFKQWCDLSGYVYTEPKQDLETVNYQKLQDKAWEMYKHVEVGDKYIATNGKEYAAYRDARKSSCDGPLDEGVYIDCGLGFLWEIVDGKEKFATLLTKETKVEPEKWIPKIGDFVIPININDIDYLDPEYHKGFEIKQFSYSKDYARPEVDVSSGINIKKIRKAEPHEIPDKIIYSTYKEIWDELNLDFEKAHPLTPEQSFKPTINRIKSELIPVKQLKTKN